MLHFAEETSLPKFSEPSKAEWHVDKTDSRLRDDLAVKYKIDGSMDLLRYETVYDSVYDAFSKGSLSEEFVKTTITVEMMVHTNYKGAEYAYILDFENGELEDACLDSLDVQ